MPLLFSVTHLMRQIEAILSRDGGNCGIFACAGAVMEVVSLTLRRQVAVSYATAVQRAFSSILLSFSPIFGHSDVNSPVPPPTPLQISLFLLSIPSSLRVVFLSLILPKECASNEAFVFVQWAGTGSKLNRMFSPRCRPSASPASQSALRLFHYLPYPHPTATAGMLPIVCEGCFDRVQLFQERVRVPTSLSTIRSTYRKTTRMCLGCLSN